MPRGVFAGVDRVARPGATRLSDVGAAVREGAARVTPTLRVARVPLVPAAAAFFAAGRLADCLPTRPFFAAPGTLRPDDTEVGLAAFGGFAGCLGVTLLVDAGAAPALVDVGVRLALFEAEAEAAPPRFAFVAPGAPEAEVGAETRAGDCARPRPLGGASAARFAAATTAGDGAAVSDDFFARPTAGTRAGDDVATAEVRVPAPGVTRVGASLGATTGVAATLAFGRDDLATTVTTEGATTAAGAGATTTRVDRSRCGAATCAERPRPADSATGDAAATVRATASTSPTRGARAVPRDDDGLRTATSAPAFGSVAARASRGPEY